MLSMLTRLPSSTTQLRNFTRRNSSRELANRNSVIWSAASESSTRSSHRSRSFPAMSLGVLSSSLRCPLPWVRTVSPTHRG